MRGASEWSRAVPRPSRQASSAVLPYGIRSLLLARCFVGRRWHSGQQPPLPAYRHCMMSTDTSVQVEAEDTPAVRFLQERNISFRTHRYQYIEKGGTGASSSALGVDEHRVVKTLVFEDKATGKPFIVLMHGDQRVDAKALAAQIGTKRVAACAPATAEEYTGYQVGGTSPFGTKNALPIYIQRTIVEGDPSEDDEEPEIKPPTDAVSEIYINGGRRGFLVSLKVDDLVTALQPTVVDVAMTKWS